MKIERGMEKLYLCICRSKMVRSLLMLILMMLF